MSNDSQRIYETSFFSDFIWMPILTIFFMVVVLYVRIGNSAFVALGLFLVLLPIQMLNGKSVGSFRRKMLKFTDERVKLMNETLQGIRVIKLYSWESSVVQKVQALRHQEVRFLRWILYLKSFNLAVLFTWPLVISTTTVIVYYLWEDDFDTPTVFLILSIIQSARFAMSTLPLGVNAVAEAVVSFRRLRQFLCLEDLKSSQESDLSDHAVYADKACFKWSESQPENTLADLSLKVKIGDLLGIVGQVGSGKTSFLCACLGELLKTSGNFLVKGNISYVSQTSWIRNATIRDNILFGEDFDEVFYNQVIKACALLPDLSILPAGDLTEIGERGINLSGGQKLRVSIARAVYRQKHSDIFLFDDPFSALDVHVGKHIFEKVLLDMLKDKTRIVCMNSQLHLLKKFDQVIVFGKEETSHTRATIVDQGLFVELASRHPDLFALPDQSEEKIDSCRSAPETISSEVKIETNSSSQKESETEAAGQVLVQRENRERGFVKLQVYLQYFKAASPNHGILLMMVLLLLFVSAQVSRFYGDAWTAFWAAGTIRPTSDTVFWIVSSLTLLIVTLLLTAVRALVFVEVTLQASKNLHDILLKYLLQARVPTFFDVTPVGSILNRFSKDVDQIDLALPDFLHTFLQNIFTILNIVLIAMISSYWMILIFVPIAVVFFWLQRYFRNSSRELQRLQQISRTPIFSCFSETLNGLITIRAFKMQEFFKKLNYTFIDRHVKVFLISQISNRWFALRLDCLSAAFVGIVALLGIVSTTSGSKESANLAALSLLYSLQLAGLLQFTIRTAVEVENNMTSVERLVHYKDIDAEAPAIVENNRPLPSWPSSGAISFREVAVRYRPKLELVLRGLSVDIAAGEKVGICGRTGSGKSSLILCLFRIIECEQGSILIDGIDISKIGLRDLRERLSIIPQEPVLLSGTVRFNLDVRLVSLCILNSLVAF